MSKTKQKELQKLKQQKQKKEQEYKTSLKKLIDQNQSIKIALNYCQEYFQRESIDESLEQYSPIHISRLIYDQELHKIQQQISKLPDQACKIQHFIVIMLKALKLPFQKTPLYMVGLKDMFRQIAQQGKQTVRYPEIFKYVIGELIITKEEQRNTQFHVQFQEKKKQDFLLHDNGINKIFYSNDLKSVLSLDNNQNMIKIYDSQMKNINRFSAKKDMHNMRIPQIIDFDYSQLTMRLGIIFTDKTIQSVHLPNFIHKTQAQFQQTSLNQLLFPLPKAMKRVYYIQMLNKWITLSDEINQLYLFDMEKVRLKPDEVMEKMTIDTNQLIVNQILEIVPLSLICVVAGNQISFYNQNFSEVKVAKYSHHEVIYKLKYSEEKNTFYLCGNYQKTITMFTINRNKTSFKISNFTINKVITDFEVFPFFQTLLIIDQSHELRLLHQPTKTVYKQQSYAHIVKMKEQIIKSYKISKSQFMVFQTYMIGLKQQKIAIQKEMQFNFLPYYYFDSKKDQFYTSLNDQIISFSVLFGQLRKNFNVQTSNIQKHNCFFLGSKTKPFIFDKTRSLYQLYLKNEEIEGQNKEYKKKLLTNEAVTYFYDQQMRNFMIVTRDTIAQIRNDSNNAFSIINYINFADFSKIVNARFCKKSKTLTLLGSNQELYQLKNFQSKLNKCFSFNFERNTNDIVQGIILDFEYCSQLQILILLNNKNQVYVIERLNPANYTVFILADYLPYKLKNLNFNKLTYSFFNEKAANKTFITLTDQTGYVLDINTHKCFVSKFLNNKIQQKTFKPFIKESYDVLKDPNKTETVILKSQNSYKLSQGDVILQKVHQKQIAILIKLKLQVMTTLTISKDGFIKLWNQKYEQLSGLKLPNLWKQCWNMSEIQNIKNKRSIFQLTSIINSHYSSKNETIETLSMIHKSKKLKNAAQMPKNYKFLQEIPLQIQSKEVEDLILQQPNYKKISLTARSYQPKIKYNPQHTTIDNHPWRTRRQFLKIYERASPVNKYAKKIPNDLLTLRVSLDMNERKKKQPNYETAQLILPQLKSYVSEVGNKPKEQKSLKKQKAQEQIQTFESCLYVRQQRRKRRRNQLDEIDRQFLQRQIELHNRRSINRYKREKQNMTIDMSQSNSAVIEESKHTVFQEIKSVFQQHNKQCSDSKRGRVIDIPHLKVLKEYE